MNLPFFSKKQHKEFYLGIFLKEDQGILMTFLKESGRLDLVDREKFIYTNGWENLTEDVDQALYKLEKNLDTEIKKTIIFVYSHLVDENIGDIKPVYLQKIKRLIKSLELEPMGYIECFEAINFYLEKTEQVSLTAILVEIDKTQLGIFAYKGGKIESKKVLARTDSIIADLSEGFAEIKKKTMLPARIVLYDSGNLDDTATQILSHRWSSDFFVQIPKVDILSEDEVSNGLISIFGEQINNQSPVKKEDSKEREKRETLGFYINEDVGDKPIIEEEKVLSGVSGIAWKNKLEEFFNKLKILVPKSNSTKSSGKILPVIGILIIFLGLFINEYFFHRAQLTVYLPTQQLEEVTQLDIDYRLASASADFSETINTTGKQEVGDKAHGSVTINNFDDQEKIFNKGSVLQTANLKFLLDTDVKVASASFNNDRTAKLPGKNSGAVTAVVIGPEGNLSKGQLFNFEGLSSSIYFAVNDGSFSGGSKKQIQTVSKKDQDDLKEIVLNKAKKEIPSIKVSPGEAVVSSLSKVDFSKIVFSKEIGEESNSLNLKATVSVTHFLYDKDSLVDKMLVLLKPEVKSQYQLGKESISYTIDQVKEDGQSLTIDTKIKAKAVIKVSPDEIKKTILGKNQSNLKEILKSQYKIDGYDLVIQEPLPLLKDYLPFFLKNIVLKNSSL